MKSIPFLARARRISALADNDPVDGREKLGVGEKEARELIGTWLMFGGDGRLLMPSEGDFNDELKRLKAHHGDQ